MKITTNNHWRDFRSVEEMPEDIRSDFGRCYGLDDAILYKGLRYPLADFSIAEGIPAFSGWDGYLNDSYSSGVLVKVSPDGWRYKIATFTC